MTLDEASCRRLFTGSRSAVLATVGLTGPRTVPIVFAIDGDVIVSAVDQKPKSTRRLRRLDDIAADARVAVLADHYEEDWDRLWWVRADCEATVTTDTADVATAVAALTARYPQYMTAEPLGPVIRMKVRRWTGWAATAPHD